MSVATTAVVVGLLVLLAPVLLWLGYWLCSRATIIERQQLRAQRQALDIEWDGLRRVQQLGHLMYWGQQRMREEETRMRPDGGMMFDGRSG